ncbi:uncharacterized protein LOC132062857 [Lycium ferocissimum]|uniref:uncharacterized protein LOC132062857 n=1 Tax=Lycium ferocissimum TaxID=112874 RepID=UPI002814DD7A|nr:uncharacterized protein LOC132062857 [Lycium ferocissimum]
MYYQRRNTASSIMEGFSLNPLPYPVLLILAVIFLFLGIQWFVSYEEVMEATEESFGWILLAVPLVLLFVVRWLSTMDTPEWFSGGSPWDRRRRMYQMPSEGSSPWGVAALIVLLLVLLQYQSTFLDMWFI